MRLKTIAILAAAALLLSLTSCGIFHKDCGCPHFGKIVAPSATTHVSKLA